MDISVAQAEIQAAEILALRADPAGALYRIDRVIAAGWYGAGVAALKAALESQLGHRHAARKSIATALAINPESGRVLAILALLCMDLGKHADAERILTEAIARLPQEPIYYAIEALLIERRAIVGWRDDLKRLARSRYEHALEIEPEHAYVRCLFAEFLVRQNALSEAEDHIRVAIAGAPNWQLPYCVAATIAIAAGEFALAEKHLHVAEDIHAPSVFTKITRERMRRRVNPFLRGLDTFTGWAIASKDRVAGMMILPFVSLFLSASLNAFFPALWIAWIALGLAGLAPAILFFASMRGRIRKSRRIKRNAYREVA